MSKRFSRRHVASKEVLVKYRANIVPSQPSENIDAVPVENQSAIGISIAGWEIKSSSSPIGNEVELGDLISHLQSLADGDKRHIECTEGGENIKDWSSKTERRLSIPEIVFCDAFVSLRRKEVMKGEEKGDFDINFIARESLGDWAECHNHLAQNTSGSHRGVNIIKTADAKLWEEKQKLPVYFNLPMKGHKNDVSTEFNYDWTFSTPYTGSFIFSTLRRRSPIHWQQALTSDMDMKLLTDQTQPILYFDDVNLYEDDMHDNGYTSLRCKLRVMPSCFYVLMTLFVRVDHVMLRVREVRLFCKFNDNDVKVSRDVCWRECKWEKLVKLGLPSNVGSWRIENEEVGGGHGTVQQRIQEMCKILPQVPLPEDISQHSFIIHKK
jgi:hypothetical protein